MTKRAVCIMTIAVCVASLGLAQDSLDVFEVCRTGTAEDVKAAIASCPNIDLRDENGMTLLMCAAGYNADPAVVAALLGAGADREVRNQWGETALMYAAGFATNPEVLLSLLSAGCDPAATNDEGETAYDYGRYNRLLEGTTALKALELSR